MENIIITGVNGFIGSHLIDFLAQEKLDKKFNIFGIEMPNCHLKNLKQYFDGDLDDIHEKKSNYLKREILIPTNFKNFNILECNLKDRELIEQIIKKIKPKYIFHLGAQPLIKPSWKDPVNTIETNVIGTINIFEPIKKYKLKTKVIIPCTATEFGTSAKINRPLRETDPLLAVHPYGISKIAVELLARQYYINFGIEAVTLRFFNQTGPRKSVGAATDFTRKVAQIDLGLSEPIMEVGNLDAYRDFTGIKDTIQALWLAAIKGEPGQTYHVCSGKKIHIRNLLNQVLTFSKKKIKVIENLPRKTREFDEDSIIGDNSKITKELGFKITQSIQEVLKDMYDYWIGYYLDDADLHSQENKNG
ncbi:MAG: NAD-dependent epimerase/dehydratase family protein [Promethearchaeota archaeon]|nr:MAG: NAD-dependent epimerase/dehydratase family protein [Candidatus Lokiarchaeota archaeon]